MKTIKLRSVFFSLLTLIMLCTSVTSYGEEQTQGEFELTTTEQKTSGSNDCGKEFTEAVSSSNDQDVDSNNCSWTYFSYQQIEDNPCRSRRVYAKRRHCNGKCETKILGYGSWKPYC